MHHKAYSPHYGSAVLAIAFAACQSTGKLLPPKLRRTLDVTAKPPNPGEPVALFGNGDVLCARRFEREVACIGNLVLRATQTPPEAWGRPRDLPRRTVRPVEVQGIARDPLLSQGSYCAIDSDGVTRCWVVSGVPKECDVPV